MQRDVRRKSDKDTEIGFETDSASTYNICDGINAIEHQERTLPR